jgi:hypothetical protein
MTSDERYTEHWVIAAARRIMGGIDLDPCSCRFANDVFVRADHYYSTGGLEKPWKAKVWLNPPFSKPGLRPWAKKLTGELSSGRTAQACVVVPSQTFNWYSSSWFPKGSVWIPYPQHYMRFWSPDDERWVGTPYPTYLLYVGPRVRRFISEFSKYGIVLCPANV